MKAKKLFMNGVVIGLVCILLAGTSTFSTMAESQQKQGTENWNVEFLGSCETRFPYANTIFIKENYAYVTSHSERSQGVCPDYNGALDIIDISTPLPSVVGTLYDFSHRNLLKPLDITVHEDYAYIVYQNGCGWYGDEIGTYIAKVDVSNPQQPMWNGILNYDKYLIYTGININAALFSSEEYLYVFTPGSLNMYMLPHLDWPVVSLSVPFVIAADIIISGRYAFLLGEIFQDYPMGWYPKIQIIDIIDPFDPVILSEIGCARSSNICVIEPHGFSPIRRSRFVYLTTNSGLQIVDVSDPTHPSIVKDIVMNSPSKSIFIQGRYAYVSSGLSGITVLDVSYPKHPLSAGYYTTEINASALTVLGTTIYAADDLSGLSALCFTSGCLSSPKRPQGPSQGSIGEEYSYQVVLPYTIATKPGEDLYLLWSWDDGTSSQWQGPYHSGGIGEAVHMWSEAGEFAVRVKMRNDAGAESPWSIPLFVTIS